ncbi:Uncharacterised protein [Legionella busanensis]|uniref:Coiled-coil protein n=1 Tax=Legionella busanensis TaxID=190655 RepID=A0A378JNS6_9GAMM|nr:hypothetical protein [Legionella busanensis]STX52905.1 Uncharacterised protein [Legionella busanensis]
MSNSLWSLILGQEGLNRARSLFVNLDANPTDPFANLKFEEAHQLRNLLPSLSSYYSFELTHINPAYFRYLNDKQREELRDKLFFMFYIFALEHTIHLIEDRKEKRIELEDKLKQCSILLDELRKSTLPLTPQNQLNKEIDSTEKCLYLLGYTIVAPIDVEKALALLNRRYKESKQVDIDANTGKINEYLTIINNARLYWVWAGSLLDNVFKAMFNQEAQEHLNIIGPAAGYMSFIVYYLRFIRNFLLLLKHTIKGFWMSAAEQEIDLPAWEKLKTQWQQRKFALLNDLIWGLANMACYLWLKGDGKLGYAGNIVCAGLLLMDLTLSIWRYKEEKKEYNEKIMALNEAKQHLLKLRTNLEEQIELREKLAECTQVREALLALLREQRELNYKLAENDKLKKDIEFNWKYIRYQHINNIAYSAILLSSFTVMSSFLMPSPLAVQVLGHAALLSTGIAGAALCFAFTTIYAAVNYAIEIGKLRESKKSIETDLDQLYKEFKGLQSDDEDSENQRKQLFLRIKGLEAEADYNRRLILFQNLKLAKSIISNVLIPALVFIALAFMPFGFGAAVIVASLLLIILTNVLINRQEPKAPTLINFNKHAYQQFQQEQDDVAAVEKNTGRKINRSSFFYSPSIELKSATEERELLLAGIGSKVTSAGGT